MSEEQKRIWDNFKPIAEVPKTASIKFVVAAAVRDGVKYINIREFYIRKRDMVWMPGRDGITIPIVYPIEQGTKLLKPSAGMVEALSKTIAALETIELLDEANAVYMTVKK